MVKVVTILTNQMIRMKAIKRLYKNQRVKKIIEALIKGPIIESKLAEKTKIDINSVSQICKQLEAEKIIRREDTIRRKYKVRKVHLEENWLAAMFINYIKGELEYATSNIQELEEEKEALNKFLIKRIKHFNASFYSQTDRSFGLFFEEVLKEAHGFFKSQDIKWIKDKTLYSVLELIYYIFNIHLEARKVSISYPFIEFLAREYDIKEAKEEIGLRYKKK